MEDPFVLLVARDSPLSRRRSSPGPADLASLSLITLTQTPVVSAVEAYFRRFGTTPRIVFRTDDNGTMQGLVNAGVGAAIAPLLTVDTSDRGVRILRLAGFPARILALAWHRDRYRSSAQQAFIERTRQICARLEAREGTDIARSADPTRRSSRPRRGRSQPPVRGHPA
jgi:DNA-binding transcriptional LysR family regulator